MAFKLADRVKETTTSTGTGTINLAGAATGFTTFVAGIGNSNTTYYCIAHQGANEFEVGIGTVTDASPDTITGRTNGNVFASSNSNNMVDFSAGTKDVFCTIPASKMVFEDGSNDVTIGRNLTVTGDLTISGDDLTMATNTSGAALIGDGTNFNPVTISGDISIAANGTAAIGSGVIVNADINSSAAIAFSKMANLTASRALVSDSNGDVSASVVTSTEIGHLDGVSDNIRAFLMGNALVVGIIKQIGKEIAKRTI